MSRRHAAVRDTALPLHILAAPGTSAEVRRLTDELAAHRRELRDVLTRDTTCAAHTRRSVTRSGAGNPSSSSGRARTSTR